VFYLVCDHCDDGMSNASLSMNIDEQRAALDAAGFTSVVRLLEMKGLVLHRPGPRMTLATHSLSSPSILAASLGTMRGRRLAKGTAVVASPPL